jgi:hypothetical protein
MTDMLPLYAVAGVLDLSRTYRPRHRGKSPHQISYFARSLRVRQETVRLASLLSVLRVIPAEPSADGSHALPSVARGDQLRLGDCADCGSLVVTERFPIREKGGSLVRAAFANINNRQWRTATAISAASPLVTSASTIAVPSPLAAPL